MTTLLESLLSIKPKNNDFVRLDLIQGYNELEIKIIEQRYNLSIHGQFREFLMCMGKCSGGVLLGKNITIFNKNYQPNSECFGLDNQREWKEHEDLKIFFQENDIDPIRDKLFYFDNRNEYISLYFLFTQNKDSIIYEYNSNLNTVQLNKYGNLFDYLIWCRKDVVKNSKKWSELFTKNPNLFSDLTTGRLL